MSNIVFTWQDSCLVISDLEIGDIYLDQQLIEKLRELMEDNHG